MTENVKSYSYGLSSSIVKIIVTAIISLFIAPIILNNIDDSIYGSILMITEFTAWFTLAQLGTSTVLSSRLPKLLLDGDKLRVNQYQGTAILTQVVLGILVFILLLLILFFFDRLFPELIGIPRIFSIFIISSLSVSLIISFQSLTAALISLKKIHVDNIIGIGTAILRIPLLLLFFNIGLDSLSIVLVDLVIVVFTLVITFLRLNKLTNILEFKWSWIIFKDLINNGSLATIGTLGGLLIHNTDRFVLGKSLGPEYVLPLVFMSKIYYLGLRFHGSIFSTIRPYISEKYSDNLSENILRKNQTIHLIELSINVAFIICALGVLMNRLFLKNWVGLDYFSSNFTNSLLACLFLLNSVALPFRILFVCTVYNMKSQNLLRVIEGVVNIGLSLFLVNKFGLDGVIFASIVSVVLFSLIGYSYLLRKGFTGESKSIIRLNVYSLFLVVLTFSAGVEISIVSKLLLILFVFIAAIRIRVNFEVLKILLGWSKS